MPRTTTSAWRRWNSAICGISWMHGTHHVAQKFNTTQCPLESSRRWRAPCVSTRSKASAPGAAARHITSETNQAQFVTYGTCKSATLVYIRPKEYWKSSHVLTARQRTHDPGAVRPAPRSRDPSETGEGLDRNPAARAEHRGRAQDVRAPHRAQSREDRSRCPRADPRGVPPVRGRCARRAGRDLCEGDASAGPEAA